MTSRLKIKHGSPHESGDNYLDLLRKLESTVRYLGIEVDDALEISEQTEI